MSDPTSSHDPRLYCFTAGADRLAAVLAGLPDSALDLSLAPGEWSIRQIVHHLADDCDVWCMGLKKAIATPGVRLYFEGFPGNDAWTAALRYNELPIAPAVALIRAHRAVMAQLMVCVPGAWDGYVDTVGPDSNPGPRVTAAEMIGFLGRHLDGHIAVIESIKREHGLSHTQEINV